VLTPSTKPAYNVAYTPRGDLFASAGADGMVRLWSPDPGRVASRVCTRFGEPITADEWAQYIPDIPYSAPC
jgi:WD40 repeat protein